MEAGAFSEVIADRRSALARRRFARLPNGLVRFDQDIRQARVGRGIDVTGPYWIFATVSLDRGTVSYLHGRELVPAPGQQYGVFFPPWSVVHCRLDRVRSQSRAVAGRGPICGELPIQPVAFEMPPGDLPVSTARMIDVLMTRRALVAIGREHGPSPLAHRVKTIIDTRFADLPPLAALAATLHTSPAVMSRYFSRDYGMPPVRYRHAIRVMDALMRLIGGEPVAGVAAAAGFDDLGQFYRQFGVLALAPPGRYRIRSRNPKTRQDSR